MKKIENLKQEIVEEGRGHPFVEALVETLAVRHHQLLELLENQTATASVTDGAIHSTGGRAHEVRNLLTLITKTQGREE